MIQNKGNAPAESESDVLLLPPRFDKQTAATARPVQPLPEGRLRVPGINMRSLFHGSNAKALVLIVILGLATGAVGGWALVKTGKQAEQPAEESVTELTGTSFTGEDAGAAVTGTKERPESALSLPRSRRSRSRGVRTGSVPRAYRVAVIR